ncbi:MAG TPA: helix-turn-helix domain-containing protein [Friedmanniella sp.]
MSLESNVRTRAVTDPVALRALAHPVRLQLYALVGREGTLTAADAAKQLDISHALASHHLRQLAKYGYLEPAEASDSRARPWRVTATSMEFPQVDPGARAPTDVIQRHAAEQAVDELVDWQERRTPSDTALADLAGAGNSLLYLSPAELAEVLAAWHDVLMTWALRRPLGHAEDRPAGAVPISLTLVVAPLRPTPHGG